MKLRNRLFFLKSGIAKAARLIAVCFPALSFAQYETNYIPIKESAALPPEFLIVPSEALKKSLSTNTLLTQEEATIYYSKVNYFKYQLIQGGKLYIHNTITSYLDSVINKLLLSEPKIKTGVKVFLTRFTQPNAFCFPDGSIFVNIGLLAALNNEAELAFILSHEIAHFYEQHSVKELSRMYKIKDEELNYTSDNSNAYRSLQFSRESEFEADSWGLQLTLAAGFDVNIAGKALLALKPDTGTIGKLDFEKVFNTGTFKTDTSWYNKAAILKVKNKYSTNDESLFAKDKLDDLFQTHPDIDKRIEAVQLITKSMKANSSTINTNEKSYGRIQLLAMFEQIENNFMEQNYISCLVNALLLSERYPENTYLKSMISKVLYWLSYYKELSADGTLEFSGKPVKSVADYDKICAMINKMSLKDSKKLAYSLAAIYSEKYNNDEQLTFYLALCTDNYLGKSAARNYYKDYLARYTAGIYTQFVKSRL